MAYRGYRNQYRPLKQVYVNRSNLNSYSRSKKFPLPLISVSFAIIIFSGYFFVKSATNNQSNQATPATPTPAKVLGISTSYLPEITVAPVVPPRRKPNIKDPNIPAKYYILLDSSTSYPLLMKNERQIVPIASITKIMTALVALDKYKLDQVVTVSSKSAYIEGSRMELRPNEKITIQDLLWGLMMVSGNDAAYALAENYPGAKPGEYKQFVTEMNKKAKSLGLLDTVYQDPAGLDDNGHSTAYDLAFLTSYALKNPTFQEIVKTPSKNVTSVNGAVVHTLHNSNRLVNPEEPLYYNQAIGVKTGFTDAAGHSLIAAARQDNRVLISVILNTYNPANEESARVNKILLEWGFQSFVW